MKSVVELEIAAPQARVATLLADPQHAPRWMNDVARYEPLEGTPGMPGSRYRLVPKKGSRTFVATVLTRDLPTAARGRKRDSHRERHVHSPLPDCDSAEIGGGFPLHGTVRATHRLPRATRHSQGPSPAHAGLQALRGNPAGIAAEVRVSVTAPNFRPGRREARPADRTSRPWHRMRHRPRRALPLTDTSRAGRPASCRPFPRRSPS